jgi:hypothetical protein
VKKNSSEICAGGAWPAYFTGIDVLFRTRGWAGDEQQLVSSCWVKILRRRSRRLPKTIAAGAALSIAFLLVLRAVDESAIGARCMCFNLWRRPMETCPRIRAARLRALDDNLDDRWRVFWTNLLWNLDQAPIDVDELPDSAFDSGSRT